MTALQFSDAQKAFILKQASDGMPVVETCRKTGIGPATFLNWKRKGDSLLLTEIGSIEATRGRERQAAQSGYCSVARQGNPAGRFAPKTAKPVRKRRLVDEVRGTWGVSIRRACRVLLVDTSSYHYKSRCREQADLDLRIKDICQTRVRYGYRRVHVLLRREGWMINHMPAHRSSPLACFYSATLAWNQTAVDTRMDIDTARRNGFL